MNKYFEIFVNSFGDYANYLWKEISQPTWNSYFYWLIGISLIFLIIEVIVPWRKNQKVLRKDFWLDAFYMFFNFFIFFLIGYNAVSNVFVELFKDGLASIGIENILAPKIQAMPIWGQLLLMLFIRDFIHFNIHRLLHRVPFLWNFHKVHHSVKEMGFAAHLRFHWMENVVYRFLEYLPLALIGFSLESFFVVYMFSLTVGHFNHSNFKLNLGPLKYIFNNPQMHIWHHAKSIPSKNHHFGVNFGLTFSFWDYIFKTAYIPNSGKDIELGFEDVDDFPKDFIGQQLYPLTKKKQQ